jgi:hypothetical protein
MAMEARCCLLTVITSSLGCYMISVFLIGGICVGLFSIPGFMRFYEIAGAVLIGLFLLIMAGCYVAFIGQEGFSLWKQVARIHRERPFTGPWDLSKRLYGFLRSNEFVKGILATLVILYAFMACFAVLWEWWMYAKGHGMLAFYTIGLLIAIFKGLFWPFFLFL